VGIVFQDGWGWVVWGGSDAPRLGESFLTKLCRHVRLLVEQVSRVRAMLACCFFHCDESAITANCGCLSCGCIRFCSKHQIGSVCRNYSRTDESLCLAIHEECSPTDQFALIRNVFRFPKLTKRAFLIA
jgi:hypothetical protein